jgi:hypothetical protein
MGFVLEWAAVMIEDERRDAIKFVIIILARPDPDSDLRAEDVSITAFFIDPYQEMRNPSRGCLKNGIYAFYRPRDL